MIKCLILAAGRGSRLGKYTKNIPKALVPVSNIPLLEWQLSSLSKAKIENINIVSGYLSNKFDKYNIPKMYNKNWSSMNMLSSIEIARSWLLDSDEVIVCYSDIIYEPIVIQKLIKSKSDIVTVVDIDWKNYWFDRFDNPLEDAETLKFNKNENIIDIGRKTNSIKSIEGQYIGITKFTNKGLKIFFNLLDEVKEGKKLLYDRSYKDGYITDILYELIKNEFIINSVKINGNWLEIDSPKDLLIANNIINSNSIRINKDVIW